MSEYTELIKLLKENKESCVFNNDAFKAYEAQIKLCKGFERLGVAEVTKRLKKWGYLDLGRD